MSPRRIFLLVSFAVLATNGALATTTPAVLWSLVLFGPLIGVGLWDMVQTKHTLRSNFPVVAHLRYFFESVRPGLQQYFVESNASGRPFSRELRSVVYQRAKNELDSKPFGTELDVYEQGYEWMSHSLAARTKPSEPHRVRIGGTACSQPYEAALLNVSAMSYGALSRNAVLALNRGAKLGGFYQNTGEGGITPHHLEGGGDLVWQIGTGYFGCRDEHGRFHPEKFATRASLPQVKMIELKLSQGAKPGHGGMLPAKKVTREIALIRDVPMGVDVVSPPTHSAFDTPVGLCRFVGELRRLSGGKPVGFKLCVGRRRELFALCKAMLETGILPDFITVDGAEGGTGAAPLEFSNRLGMPLDDAIVLVHNALVGCGLRRQIRIIASGRVVTAFCIARALALGADLVNSARAMMFSLGCIQALKCNTNHCPTGIATQDPELVRGLDVADKAVRVFRYQSNTIDAFDELIAAAGLDHPHQLRPWHVHRRVSTTDTRHLGEIYDYLEPGALLCEPLPRAYARAFVAARADTWESASRDGRSMIPPPPG